MQPILRAPNANNWARMTVEIEAKNLCIILLQDFVKYDKYAMGLVLDAKYQHKWAGDSWYGPGSVSMEIDAFLNKIFLFKAN